MKNEILLIEKLTDYLKKHNVFFYEDGFPKMREEWFIEDKPKAIVPFNKRHYCNEAKKNTSICFFSGDEFLYPRFETIENDLSILKEYHSICMMDVSISPLMLDEVQRINLLLNLLYTCVVAANGIKVIPSMRSGSDNNLSLLIKSIGFSKYWVTGMIGTQDTYDVYHEFLFRKKLLIIDFDCLLLYGKPNKKTREILDELGVNYIVYDDFRSISYSSVNKSE